MHAGGRAETMAAIRRVRLQYARAPAGLRRRWRWVVLLAGVLVAAGSAAGWRRVRPWVEQRASLRGQQRCMVYVAPAGASVAYEEVPARGEELLRPGGYGLPPMLSTGNPPQQEEWYPYATLAPAPWRSLG